MIKFFLIVLLLICSTFAELQMPPYATTLTNLLMRQEYSRALEYADSIVVQHPEDADAQYMRLNIFQTKMLDYESYSNDTLFIDEAESFLNFLSKKTNYLTADDYTRIMLFRGNIIGAKALVQTKQEKWVEGFKNARLSVKILSETYKRDSTYYESCLATGVFDYYVGKTFKWVPFVGKREEKGISKIETAASRNSLFKFAAIHSLLWIFIEKEEYNKADSLVSDLLNKYPDNTILLRIKARNEFLRGNDSTAMILGKELAEKSSKRIPINWSDMFSGYEIMIRILDSKGETQKCLEVISEALKYKVPESAKKIIYVKNNLEYIGVANMKCKKDLKKQNGASIGL